MNSATSPARIDVRALAPHERHPLIFSAFGSLGAGQAMELVNDHDPQPLHQQFQARLPGQFDWNYMERGPHTWRVAITRVAAAPSHGACCGSCSGS